MPVCMYSYACNGSTHLLDDHHAAGVGHAHLILKFLLRARLCSCAAF